MENYTITITPSHQYHFQVIQYPHHASGGCQYKIFQDTNYIASLEPDGRDFLHVCNNPGNVDIEILHLLAEQIQARHPMTSYLNGFENN